MRVIGCERVSAAESKFASRGAALPTYRAEVEASISSSSHEGEQWPSVGVVWSSRDWFLNRSSSTWSNELGFYSRNRADALVAKWLEARRNDGWVALRAPVELFAHRAATWRLIFEGYSVNQRRTDIRSVLFETDGAFQERTATIVCP
jgi:hypothetical protein